MESVILFLVNDGLSIGSLTKFDDDLLTSDSVNDVSDAISGADNLLLTHDLNLIWEVLGQVNYKLGSSLLLLDDLVLWLRFKLEVKVEATALSIGWVKPHTTVEDLCDVLWNDEAQAYTILVDRLFFLLDKAKELEKLALDK